MLNNKYALHIPTKCVVFSYEMGSASINRFSPVKGACLKWMGFAGKNKSIFRASAFIYLISLSFAFSNSTLPRLPRKAWVNGNTCFLGWNTINCCRLRSHVNQEEVDAADWYSRAFTNYKWKRDSAVLSMGLAAHSQFKYSNGVQWGC